MYLRIIFLCFFSLEQLIKEPTRVTTISSTLIHLVFTNQPNNISNSSIIDLRMSDHSLIYAVQKMAMPKYKQTISRLETLKDLMRMILCRNYLDEEDPNNSWQIWKSFFLEVLDPLDEFQY